MRTVVKFVAVLGLLWSVLSAAQSATPLTVFWPSSDSPTLKLTFSPFQQSGVVNTQGIFVSDVTAQNVSDQGMPKSVFTVLVSDKDGVRIGSARLQLPEIPAFRTQKGQLQFSATRKPASVALIAGKTIPLRVISVPAGANLKVDGQDAGVTPKVVEFTIGAHTLEFSKEGYASGTTPLDVGADELPGGSINFELGGLSQDMVELRDGTTLLGDVISMSMTSVVVRADGKDQTYERNQIRKLILVERINTVQKPVIQTVPAKPKN